MRGSQAPVSYWPPLISQNDDPGMPKDMSRLLEINLPIPFQVVYRAIRDRPLLATSEALWRKTDK